jgi:hypothetical protein
MMTIINDDNVNISPIVFNSTIWLYVLSREVWVRIGILCVIAGEGVGQDLHSNPPPIHPRNKHYAEA